MLLKAAISIIIHFKKDFHIELFTNKGGFTTDYEKYLQVILDIFQTAQVQLNKEEILDFGKKRFKDEDIQIVKDYLEIINDEDSEVYKILAFSHKHEKLEHIKSSLNRIESLVITSSGHGNLEFNDENAQKGIAIKTLANYLGLEMKDVMAIGDNLNDVSMLKMAGLSVAMGNSDEKIQEMCDFTTKTNNEHGVAFAIKYMLSKDCQ
ncbi:MAG: HAD-IIB family hydrolase [Firmicutes bacterium]|nr:HAD-IIB family hydrolase [Bacillota bacterium]